MPGHEEKTCLRYQRMFECKSGSIRQWHFHHGVFNIDLWGSSKKGKTQYKQIIRQ